MNAKHATGRFHMLTQQRLTQAGLAGPGGAVGGTAVPVTTWTGQPRARANGPTERVSLPSQTST